MKRLGIIGGISAASTAHYYALINEGVQARLGGLAQAELLIWSVNFAEVAALQEKGEWQTLGVMFADIARRLEGAGAEAIIIAANTMHKVADEVTAAVTIPLLHIVDITAAAIRRAGLKRPGLMATAYTMEQDFYVGRFRDRHGLSLLIPGEADRRDTHRIIYDELCRGVTTDVSRARYEDIARALVAQGADCLILGCTEVGMLLNQGNVPVPVFDTTQLHTKAAVDFATGHSLQQAAE